MIIVFRCKLRVLFLLFAVSLAVAASVHSSGLWAQWEQCDGKHCDKGSRYRRKIKLSDSIEVHDRACGSSNCEELRVKGYGSGDYTLKIDDDAKFMVYCDMSHRPAWTVIKHNYPNRTEAKPAPYGPDGNTYYIRYQGVNIEHLKAFVDRQTCTQFLRYDCHHSVISPSGIMWAYWKDRYGNKVNYWPGGEANRHGCACGVDKSCANPSNFCECDSNDEVWRHDEGTIRDNQLLPVTGLHLVDTAASVEMGFFTLGPLICV